MYSVNTFSDSYWMVGGRQTDTTLIGDKTIEFRRLNYQQLYHDCTLHIVR